jgi:hypothetical protein
MADPPLRYGDLVIQRAYPFGPIHVLHADPVILISHELLEQVRTQPAEPWVELDTVDGAEVLRITPGLGAPIVYRIGPYLPDLHAHVATWPD